MSTSQALPASFRDPSGFLYTAGDTLLRQVNSAYAPHYERLMESGLYQRLVDAGLLVAHTEIPGDGADGQAWKVLQPERVPFISYPYEWSFHQLKAAAEATLKIQTLAFEHGMVLKDASAYNIQFIGTRPVFIDTLSFEIYEPGTPWVAYRQFCQHFLAPLAVMSKTDERLGLMLANHIDGLPLDLAVALLPWQAKLRPGIFMHLVLHARSQARYADAQDGSAKRRPAMSEMGFRGIIDSLQGIVGALGWSYPQSEWGDYYAATNYEDDAMANKKALVRSYLESVGTVTRVVDAGANTGVFSRLAEDLADHVVAMDIDPVAVDRNFIARGKEGDGRLLPLRIDLTNPSPALGWDNTERDSITARCRGSVVMALALIHHIAISNNVPLARVAQFFHGFADHLIIEFVPKSDSQVQRLLATREDIFPDYTEAGFEAAFGEWFEVLRSEPVAGSARTLYLLRPKAQG